MFEDSLLIIKSDYLHKRKAVLLHLLTKGFQIQGHRRVQFTPEQAAEFYHGGTEDKAFMLQVILLSKCTAEAFLLTKTNCVEDLVNTMVCYFTTSNEMERNVHVSRTPENMRREITFVFPNYIHEPIFPLDRPKFCQNKLMGPLINQLYEVQENREKDERSWKVRLAEWLIMSNKSLPHISTQCSVKVPVRHQEKAQQIPKKHFVAAEKKEPCSPVHTQSTRSHTPTFSTMASSMLLTSSTCITCSCFDGETTCLQPPPVKEVDSALALIRARTQKLGSSRSESSEPERVCGEEECLQVIMEMVYDEDEPYEGEVGEEHIGEFATDIEIVEGVMRTEPEPELEPEESPASKAAPPPAEPTPQPPPPPPTAPEPPAKPEPERKSSAPPPAEAEEGATEPAAEAEAPE